MPNIDNMFPSRYLKAGDLDGREITLTIKELKLEAVGQGKDTKPVLYFRGATKGLVLNVTNSKRIAMICGSRDSDNWPGRKIILYATETEFQGDTVDCIRVRVPKNKLAAEPEPPVKAKKAKKAVEPEPNDPFPTAAAPAADRDDDDEQAADAEEDDIPF